MGLYPNILFHFTSKDALYAILADAFKPSYARETILSKDTKRYFGVPMVSFCDLRLSELGSFVSSSVKPKYGNFGIGLTKEWANRSGLNPVLYVSRHAELVDDLVTGVDQLFAFAKNETDATRSSAMHRSVTSVMNTYRFIKNYEGDLDRTGMAVVPDYRFADEREWRFVPSINRQDILAFARIGSDWAKDKAKLNASVQNERLHFGPDDVKYLIVEKEADIWELMDCLKGATHKYDEKSVMELSSRILTVEQIEQDI